MTVRMTDKAIQAAVKRAAGSGKRLDISDATLPGLRLRLTPSGGRSWVLACRDTLGGMRRFPLGDYPAMGISEAREAARSMRADVRKGADPVAEARRKRIIGQEARDGIGTLTAVWTCTPSRRATASNRGRSAAAVSTMSSRRIYPNQLRRSRRRTFK